MKTYVYYLLDERCGDRDPLPGEHAYVGVSINPLKRWGRHSKEEREKTYKDRWVQKLIEQGSFPFMRLCCIVEREEEAFRVERLLIPLLRKKGVILVNTAEGGKGGDTWQNLPEENRKDRLARKRAEFTPERRAEISEQTLGRRHTLATRNRISQTLKATLTPEMKKARGDAKLGQKDSPEVKEKKRLAALKRYENIPFPLCAFCQSPVSKRTRKYCSHECYSFASLGTPKSEEHRAAITRGRWGVTVRD